MKRINSHDLSLNETVTDKIRKYHSDYNNNTPSSVVLMTPIPSTSGRFHSEFVVLLFLQDHRAIHQWSVPLQTRSLLLTSSIQGRHHSHQGRSTEDHPQRRRRTCVVQITHSPITLANCSFINLVYVFRYYGSSRP